eukprot:1653681-Ditylum_brightwellii.AAC.1
MEKRQKKNGDLSVLSITCGASDNEKDAELTGASCGPPASIRHGTSDNNDFGSIGADDTSDDNDFSFVEMEGDILLLPDELNAPVE